MTEDLLLVVALECFQPVQIGEYLYPKLYTCVNMSIVPADEELENHKGANNWFLLSNNNGDGPPYLHYLSHFSL